MPDWTPNPPKVWPEIWPDIDTVLLDMDGTLLDLRYDNRLWNELVPEHYAHAQRLTPEEARRRLFEHMGAIRSTLAFYCIDYWSTFTGLDIRGLHEQPTALLGWRPGAAAFLERLATLGKRRVLVTNAHRASLAVKHAHTGIAECLDAVVSSHDFGAPKEHDEFWQRLRAAQPYDPARTLLIDDNEHVLAAAARNGVGHLVTVTQPDSGRAPRTQLRWPAFNDFAEIMPR